MKNTITFFLLIMGNFCFAQKSSQVDFIKKHLTKITKSQTYRNHTNTDRLDKVANYIRSEYAKHADSTSFQDFNVDGKTFRNVICSFGTENKKRIIIGAHYDVCGNQEGADDNASGVVGLIELSRLLKGEKLKYRIDLVAYSLEEPPYFRTESMGSYIHAKSLVQNKVDVYGMISLEMIGYFSDIPNSQLYPDQSLSKIHGNKGDFITLVNRSDKKQFASYFGAAFKNVNTIKTVIFDNPPTTEGIDFSDHLNYWKFDISALMITDTAFLRNPNYHKTTDTVDTLDLNKMTKVINGIFQSVLKL